MANYISLSLPRADAELALEMLSRGLDRQSLREIRVRERLARALEGRDLRATNRHNVHVKHPPRPRVGLDLRRKSA